MSVAQIKAGRAFYEILAEDKTKGALDSAANGLKDFGRRIATVGAAMTGFATGAITGLTALVKAFSGAGDEISDAMNVTGLSSDFLQALKFGAADAGVNFNALIGSLTKFNSFIAKAASGNKAANKTLSDLGLNIKDLVAMNPDERFKAVAEAISKVSDPAKRAALAVQLLGKTGAKLLPALEGGAQSLNESIKDLQDRGLIMSDADRQLAVDAEGAFLKLGLALSRIGQVIAAAVTPAFVKVLGAIQMVAESVIRFIDNNRTLVVWLTGGVIAIGAAGIALMGLGLAATAAGYALTGLAAAGTTATAVIAFLTSPIFIVTAALVAMAVAAGVSAYYLDQLYNNGDGFNALADAATEAQAAVTVLWQAIANGRWDLAGKLMGDGIKLGFYGAIVAIKQAWNDMVNWMVMSILDAVKRIEAQLPKWVADKLGIGEAATGVANTAASMTMFDLQDEQAKNLANITDFAKTMADIQRVDAEKKRKREQMLPFTGPDGGLGGLAQDKLFGASAGAFNSAAASRLGFAAPANSIGEKQLDVLQQIKAGIDEVAGGIDGLEGLVAD